MTQYLYLDIETVPTTDADRIAEIAASITCPGNISKPESIAAWEVEKKPKLVEEAVAKTSFSGAYGKVCCIGWAWDDFEARSTIGTDEREVIQSAFDRITNGHMSAVPIITIVGHYVANFDLRFLMQRAIVLGIRLPDWLPRDPKPWSREVFDTMAAWAGAKDTISLDNLCRVLGIPGKDGVDGSMVAGMWQRGEYDAIASYCRDDVDRVRSVHRKMQVAFGELKNEAA
jgi:predicted PolB exonuclease-like 3'-5' exonuclease